MKSDPGSWGQSLFAYALDSAGNRLRVTESYNAQTNWFYDDLYQLMREMKLNIVGA